MALRYSVAQRGRPWENGYAERLIRTLKEEEVNINDYSKASPRPEIASDNHTGVSSETPTFGVRVFDTYGISTTNLILTLRNCGLRMHFIGIPNVSEKMPDGEYLIENSQILRNKFMIN